ncbi:AAA family ATPase [Chitinophaga sp. CF418]|uniref:AAA family ATPase n=1 Tax=Chitinophaga sp. CF418 TaxID=1855287 RepID=UPI00091E8486|nr:AAA family ATPase [Chitinophaga sp. CF418]SHN10627.1 HTH-type transcriptional regulator, transcriptional repressor of NAD biosynthesis genes [Chitinophaga sp. CF418]
MRKGFVFGKFMPFHKGHEAMIRFALSHCDIVSVLVCCSNREVLPAALRQSWLEATFRDEPRVKVLVYQYDEHSLPNTSATSASVSAVWAKEFKQLFPDHNIVVTSEPYGELVAGYMGITHIPFDMQKNQFPVSATKIRANLPATWAYLPESVKASLITKVVLLGTESTGKTTLTGRLAAHFNCSAVMEAGRDIVADSNDFGIGDLYLIAREHARRINAQAIGESPLLIIDTDIHITLSYGEYAFGELLDLDRAIYDSNKADLYLYLNNDAPYIQDGTRLGEDDRNLLDLSHRRVLKKSGITYEEVRGDWDERFEQAVVLIEQLMQQRMENWLSFTGRLQHV